MYTSWNVAFKDQAQGSGAPFPATTHPGKATLNPKQFIKVLRKGKTFRTF